LNLLEKCRLCCFICYSVIASWCGFPPYWRPWGDSADRRLGTDHLTSRGGYVFFLKKIFWLTMFVKKKIFWFWWRKKKSVDGYQIPSPVRDRPFNLQGRLWFLVSFRNLFSDNTRELFDMKSWLYFSSIAKSSRKL
jgi:hypothetical protein